MKNNHYPAIDVLASISRLMAGIATPEHNFAAGRLRAITFNYQENRDLISIGAYKGESSNPSLTRRCAILIRLKAAQQNCQMSSRF